MFIYMAVCGTAVCLSVFIAILKWGFQMFLLGVVYLTVAIALRVAIHERKRLGLPYPSAEPVADSKPQAFYSNRR